MGKSRIIIYVLVGMYARIVVVTHSLVAENKLRYDKRTPAVVAAALKSKTSLWWATSVMWCGVSERK